MNNHSIFFFFYLTWFILGTITHTYMIENQIIYWYLALILFFGVVGGFINILAPNYFAKRYVSGKSQIPRDNTTRFLGIIFLGLSVYAFAWLLGYVK